ncbi:MAG: HEAT repeat domain-containing protein [Pseudonocardia sp.]|nr:MAG: HEAT repeat domain-containing protein [Pseudonocardia sp.]
MTVSKQDVLAVLEPDEVDYVTAASLGPEALPHLAALVTGEDAMLAAKATYLASMIPDEGRQQILSAAAVSAEPTVRIAAAVGSNTLRTAEAETLVAALLTDDDVGVRKQAILSSAQIIDTAAVQYNLQRIIEADTFDTLRRMAEQVLGE